MTPHSRDVIDSLCAYIAQHVADYTYPPTFDQIAAAMGWRSKNTVAWWIDKAETAGRIRRGGRGQARALKLLIDK